MKGPFRRNSERRQPAEPGPQEQQPTTVAPPLQDQHPTVVAPPQPEPPSAQAPPAEPQAPAPEALPAGVAPEDVAPSRPSFRDRARLRRRLRYLRRVRELGFRDLGGLAFDLHRFARRNDELVLGKLAALDAVDRELRAIERVLDERRDIIELREPGIAACPRCGALHGSDARFCPQCGIAFSGPLAMVEVGGAVQTAPEPTAPGAATDPPTEVVSGDEATTPVSGALEGNPPPEAPPAEPEATAPATEEPETAAPGSGETAGGPGEVVEADRDGATDRGAQPTQAFSSLGPAGGDPLARHEHREP